MKRIAFCSDLHMDFTGGDIFSNDLLTNAMNSDVLCLLGDSFEINTLNKPAKNFYIRTFFDEISKNYPVILVLYIIYTVTNTASSFRYNIMF